MVNVIKTILPFILIGELVISAAAQPGVTGQVDWKNVHGLVYTKNGKGYVHENIAAAVACLQQISHEKGFTIEVSDNPSVFSIENLKKFSFVIFASTNNDVFDTDEQRLTFRRYMEGGGGFVGIHSVIGTERNWKWFKTMLGGTFDWHPPFQRYRIQVIDYQHSSVAGLPAVWEKEDECYFMKEMYPGIKTIMAHDLTSLQEKDKEKIIDLAGPFSGLYPAVWQHSFDGGIAWITALGHDKKDFSDPVFIQHLFQGIAFVAKHSTKPDFNKSYAKTKDDSIQNPIR